MNFMKKSSNLAFTIFAYHWLTCLDIFKVSKIIGKLCIGSDLAM